MTRFQPLWRPDSRFKPLPRVMFRVGVTAGLAVMLAAPGAGSARRDAEFPEAAPGYLYRPPNSDFVDRVHADYLNDDAFLPHALSINEGTLTESGEAEFALYGLTPQSRAINVTYDWRYFYRNLHNEPVWRRGIRVEVRSAPGSRSVKGEIRYDDTDGARIIYTPDRLMRVDRTAILTFSYLGLSKLKTEFILQLPAQR